MKLAIFVIVLVGLGGLAWLLRPLFNKDFRRKAGIAIGDKLPSEEPIKPPNEGVAQQKTFEDLLDAIEWVESKGDANAVGDNGYAVGSFQIHNIYVRDVNRIDNACFRSDDRKSRKASRMMVDIYTKWYASRAFDETGDETKFFEYAARCHNGGPDGWKKECTKAYWAKVEARLEK